MKTKIIGLLMALLFVLSPIALAEEVVETYTQGDEQLVILDEASAVELTVEEEAEVGVTPDQGLAYGFKRMFENFDLAFTFNKEKQAEKRLVQARKRILEVQKMIAKGDVKSAEKAQKGHDAIMAKVQERIQKLENADPEKEMQMKLKIEEKLQKHYEHIQAVEAKIGKMVQGQLNAMDKASVSSMMGQIRIRLVDANQEMVKERKLSEEKLRARLEKSEPEIRQQIEAMKAEIRTQVRIEEQVRIQKVVQTAVKQVEQVAAKEAFEQSKQGA